MGIYLIIVASADVHYGDGYYLHDTSWRSGVFCRVAGIISMLSSEMSVYALILITTDRLLVLGMGRGGLGKTKCQVLAGVGWVFWILISILPVSNLQYFGSDDYIRHRICFLFNLSEGKVSGWHYATAIFIGFNALALVYLAFTYTFIFVVILVKTGFDGNAEALAARKMILVVLTDCACWVPPIVLGIMSLLDMEVSQTMAVWVSVFVFPLNSALNPFLYTFMNCCKSTGDDCDGSDEYTVYPGQTEFVAETDNTERPKLVDSANMDENSPSTSKVNQIVMLNMGNVAKHEEDAILKTTL